MKSHNPDYKLLITSAIIVIFGLVMLSSASMAKSQESFGNPYYYLKHQLLYGILPGILLGATAYKINYRVWKKFSFVFFVASIILLAIVFLPGISHTSGGATRWISIGSNTLQTSEFAKLGFIIYLAAWLSEKKKNASFSEIIIPFCAATGIIIGLILLQPNIGTAGLFGLIALIMYFSAGAPIKHIGAIIGIGLAGFFSLLTIFPHAKNRFEAFKNPDLDPLGKGYQIKQALLAIGSGGFFGKGIGKSVQKFNYLPEVIGDSIFAIIAEELGFVGALFLIGLFLYFAVRGFKIAQKAPDSFGRLLAVGIVSWLSMQTMINIMANCKLIPLTGVPMPLISYGASGLLAALTAIGILLNISKHC